MTYYSYVRPIISGVEKPPTTEWEENPPDHGYIELVIQGVHMAYYDAGCMLCYGLTHTSIILIWNLWYDKVCCE